MRWNTDDAASPDAEVDVAGTDAAVDVAMSPSSPLPSVETARSDDVVAAGVDVVVTDGLTTTSLLLSACQINGAEALSVAELNHIAGRPTLLNCESMSCALDAAVVL